MAILTSFPESAGTPPAPSARLRSEYDSAGRSMAIEAARDQMC